MGPTQWAYCRLHVVLDTFRQVVDGWRFAGTEIVAMFKSLSNDATAIITCA